MVKIFRDKARTKNRRQQISYYRCIYISTMFSSFVITYFHQEKLIKSFFGQVPRTISPIIHQILSCFFINWPSIHFGSSSSFFLECLFLLRLITMNYHATGERRRDTLLNNNIRRGRKKKTERKSHNYEFFLKRKSEQEEEK